jgi:hypothetical protein
LLAGQEHGRTMPLPDFGPIFTLRSIVVPAAGLDAELVKVAPERILSFGLRRVGQRLGRTPHQDAARPMSPAACRVILLPIRHTRRKTVPSRACP